MSRNKNVSVEKAFRKISWQVSRKYYGRRQLIRKPVCYEKKFELKNSKLETFMTPSVSILLITALNEHFRAANELFSEMFYERQLN